MTLARLIFHGRRRIMFNLAVVILSLTLVTIRPVQTVRGLVQNTGFHGGPLTIDGNLVAFGTGSIVRVYDLNTGSLVSFALPLLCCLGPSSGPIISGNKIAIAQVGDHIVNGVAVVNTWEGIYYCNLPRITPLAACGPWKLVANVTSQFRTNSGVNAGMELAFRDGLLAWPISQGSTGAFSYTRLGASIAITNVTLPASSSYPYGLSTNGAVIAFVSFSAVGYPTLQYYDTTDSSPTVVDTQLGADNQILYAFEAVTSLAQNIIAFEDNSSTGDPSYPEPRIQYYDLSRGQASPAGAGPIGRLGSIWGGRIVYGSSETSLGNDCNNDGTISSNQVCVQYWNIAGPSWVTPYLAPQASPFIAAGCPGCVPHEIAIYDHTLVFAQGGTQGFLQYATVPMRGDVNQDGQVNIFDLTAVGGCFGQLFKAGTC